MNRRTFMQAIATALAVAVVPAVAHAAVEAKGPHPRTLWAFWVELRDEVETWPGVYIGEVEGPVSGVRSRYFLRAPEEMAYEVHLHAGASHTVLRLREEDVCAQRVEQWREQVRSACDCLEHFRQNEARVRPIRVYADASRTNVGDVILRDRPAPGYNGLRITSVNRATGEVWGVACVRD